MSEHALPLDSNDWPSDPYRLLGVWPGVSGRDLRRAYLDLVRRFKPEHHPAEFQKIRRAYEVARESADAGRAARLDAIDVSAFQDVAEVSPTTHAPVPKALDSTVAPESGPWDLACEGDLEGAYRRLVEEVEASSPREEPYLQLHWLLVIEPGLDPDRTPFDWLVRGALATGGRCRASMELIRRAIDADPALGAGDRARVLLGPAIAPGFLIEFVRWRWRAARRLRLWPVIRSDVSLLSPRSSGDCDDAWPRVAIAAVEQLIWADAVLPETVKELCREIEARSHRHNDLGDELFQLDFALELTTAWRLLRSGEGLATILHAILPSSCDEPPPDLQPLLVPLLAEVARTPHHTLNYFDRLLMNAPSVLGQLAGMFQRFDLERPTPDEPRTAAQISGAIQQFAVAAKPWSDYPRFRRLLLAFCLKTAIAPDTIAIVLRDPSRFAPGVAEQLAATIDGDWSLRIVYWACTLAA